MQRTVAEVSTLSTGSRLPKSERLADHFAKAFLMPRSGLERRFDSIRRAKESPMTPADILGLSQLYSVSFQAMTLRLEGLDLLKRGTWDFLREMGFKPESARKLLPSESDGTSEGVRPARRFAALAVQAIEQELLSIGQVAKRLGTDVSGVQALIEQYTTETDLSPSGEWQQVELDFSQKLQLAM
jgi:Zn-dependent peptidase ImmA (M78 family)